MDLLVTGTPGPLLEWTCDFVRAVAQAMHVTVEAAQAHNQDPYRPPEDSRARILVAGYLEPEHEAAIRAGLLRAIIVVDSAHTSFAALRSQGSVAALRNISLATTPLGQLAGCRHACIVTPADAAPRHLIGVIIRHCHWTLTDGSRAELEARFANPICPIMPPSGEAPEAVEQVLQPAFLYAATGLRDSIVWPRSCLLWGDHPGEAAPRVLDLTGPSRILVYGPYFRMPPGRWTATVQLAFSPSCEGAMLALEMHAATLLGRSRFAVPHAGLFEATLPFTVPSARDAIELRLVSERGAIEGALGVDHVALTPVPG